MLPFTLLLFQDLFCVSLLFNCSNQSTLDCLIPGSLPQQQAKLFIVFNELC